MLKYAALDVVCSEVPDEVSLAVGISGCLIRCPGCHSRDLWEDKGHPLDVHTLENMLYNHKGITCLLLLGGEHDIDTLIELFQYAHRRIKTAWYCGLDMIPKDKLGILDYLDFCKTGHYDAELGGLDSPTTNQRLYKHDKFYSDASVLGAGWRDITWQLNKQNKEKDN